MQVSLLVTRTMFCSAIKPLLLVVFLSGTIEEILDLMWHFNMLSFDRFMGKCDDMIPPTDEDCLAAAKLCLEMARYFENEKVQVHAFISVLEEYLGIPISTNYEVSTGFCDFVFVGLLQ